MTGFAPELLITGIGRCGTSLMAAFFRKLGWDIGSSHWDFPVRGGFECMFLKNFNRSLADQLIDSDTRTVAEAAKTELDAAGDLSHVRAVKDSSFTLYPEILPVWAIVRPSVRFLLMTRPGRDIARGFRELPPPRFAMSPASFDFLQHYVAETLAWLGLRHSVLKYPEDTDKFESVARALQSIGIELPKDAESVWMGWYRHPERAMEASDDESTRNR